jgi:NAD-dependent DNA ligase
MGTNGELVEPVSKLLLHHQRERACARLQGVIAGITADGHLHDLEVQFLRTWLAENDEVRRHWLGSQLSEALDEVMADGVVSEAERASLLDMLQAITGVHFADTGCVTPEAVGFPADDCEVSFPGRTFVLTGKFHHGSRGDCEAITVAAGGVCADSVTKKVHYLVIGSAGATVSWKQASYGNKIDAAMKLREKGHPIFIVNEDAWRAAVTGGQ